MYNKGSLKQKTIEVARAGKFIKMYNKGSLKQKTIEAVLKSINHQSCTERSSIERSRDVRFDYQAIANVST